MFKFHYFKQQPTKYINQKFKFFFPFGTWRCGIGVLIARREFSITWPPIITSKEIKTATDKQYLVAGLDRWTVREAHGEPDWSIYNHAEEIQNLRSLVNELLPYMLNDMTQGLAIGPSDHCKDAQAPCRDCQWYEDASLWKKRWDAGEFKDYSL